MSDEENAENGAVAEQVTDTPVEKTEEFYGALEEFQGKEASTEKEEEVKQPEEIKEHEKQPEQKPEEPKQEGQEAQEAKTPIAGKPDPDHATNGLKQALIATRKKLKAATQPQEQDPNSEQLFTDPLDVRSIAQETYEELKINESFEKAIRKDPIGFEDASAAVNVSPYLQERVSNSYDVGEEILNIARVKKSISEAHAKHGEEYAKAVEFIDGRADLSDKVFSSKNPGEAVLKLFKRENIFSGFYEAEDPDAFILKLSEDIRARQSQQQSAPPQQQPPVKLPSPSLAKATGTAPTQPVPPENVADYAFRD